jgi:hypothetical protein
MPKKSQAPKMVFIAVSALLLGTLACALDFGNSGDGSEISVQQTLVALRITQAALENQEADPPPDPPVNTEEPQPEEPQTEAVPTEPPDIVFEGAAFSYDQSLAQSITPARIQGQNMGEEVMPSETYPTHLEFTLNGYAVREHFHTPRILIYPVEDYRAISPYADDIIDALKQTLISKPGGGSLSDLPFLPMWNAAQVFSARVEYFSFQNGSGVRYLSMYGQALWPVDNQNLFYTYQGLTDDSQYYICAILPITHNGLPNEGQVDDWAAFEANWENYIADTLTWLEAQDPNSFFPSLNTLDAMLASFEINP